jgi:sulfatase modifying factor 1
MAAIDKEVRSAFTPSDSMEFVNVGDPRNQAAEADSPELRLGRVNYEYRIGKYEVTYGQYVEFLNAKAQDDPTGLYDPSMTNDKIGNGIQRAGTPGSYVYSLLDEASSNRPVTYVNFTDAARFANWMNNGKGDASTESGAYRITTAKLQSAFRTNGVNTYITKGKQKIQVGDQVTITGFKGIGFDVRSQIESVSSKGGKTSFTIKNDYGDAVAKGNGRVVAVSETRSPDAAFWIPNEDEWFKAAYYDPDLNEGTGGYYTWATQSNEYPGNTIGAMTNQANIPGADGASFANTPLNPNISPSTGPNLLTPVGAFTNSASHYGTFDQDGNVTEWTETVYDSKALFGNWNKSPNSTRAKHGAMYYSGTPGSSRRDDGLMPNDIGYGSGFRLAAAAIAPQSSNLGSNSLRPEDSGDQTTSDPITLNASASHNHSKHSHRDHHHTEQNNKNTKRAVFGGPIEASQELWPTVYPAHGSARLVLNAEQTELRYKFRITGLDFGEIAGIGPVTVATGDDVNGMHIHYAPAGQVGDPVIGIINPNQDEDTRYRYNKTTKYWTITGCWTSDDPSVVNFKDNLENYLFQGLNYLNIHNEDVVLGVIRGQFNPLNKAAKTGPSAFVKDSSKSHREVEHLYEYGTSSYCGHEEGLSQQSLRDADALTGNYVSTTCMDHGFNDSSILTLGADIM